MRAFTMLRGLLFPLGAVAVVLFFAMAVDSLDSGRQQEGVRQLEEALRRGCAACYAAEGVYPPNLEYLRTYYGVQADEERYVIYYTYIADNLMPDITVFSAGQGSAP